MSRLQAETLSIRTSTEVNQLVPLAAERERRSVASVIEILLLEHARQHGLQVQKPQPLPDRGTVLR